MIQEFIQQAEQDSLTKFKEINTMVDHNQHRVLQAFKEEQIGDHHFSSTDGYGYDDSGRDALEAVYANVFGGEDALVRPQIVSGTHAISTALFGLLRPHDELLYIAGSPYDTLEEVLGKRGEESGSLKELQVTYNEVALDENNKVDFASVKEKMNERTKVIGIQRSKRYEDRPSFTISELEELVGVVKSSKESVIVFVDKRHGESVGSHERLPVGADIIGGPLIKPHGGGLVRAGRYLAGNQGLIQRAASRLTA